MFLNKSTCIVCRRVLLLVRSSAAVNILGEGVVRMSYDYRKLFGRILEKFGTQSAFSKAFGLSEYDLFLRLVNEVDFDQGEIDRACSLLEISEKEMYFYFFTRKVQRQ